MTRDHHDFLFALARKLCRSHFDPEDLVQEVLLKTLANLGQLPEGVNHRAWMTQVMKNLFTDQVRRAKTRSKFEAAAVTAPAPVADEPPWWHQLDSGHIRRAMAELPDELRETFDRFAFRGQSYQQIADELAIAKPTVGTRILRARQRLKQLLQERGAS